MELTNNSLLLVGAIFFFGVTVHVLLSLKNRKRVREGLDNPAPFNPDAGPLKPFSRLYIEDGKVVWDSNKSAKSYWDFNSSAVAFILGVIIVIIFMLSH